MKADEEHGVRWKLILPPWEEDDDGSFMDAEGNIMSPLSGNKPANTEVQEKIAARKCQEGHQPIAYESSSWQAPKA